MEREGEMRKEGRGSEKKRGRGRRGGVEMRRGIVIGGMVIGLLMGCNNGGESAAEKGLSEIIANSKQLFLNAFVSFGDLLLKESFSLSSTTTKKEVGDHLGKVGAEVSLLKNKLEGIKSDENYNLIKDKADGVINKAIGILENIVEGTNKIKQATASASDKIGNATTGNTDDAAPPSETESVQGLVKGISMIYEAATKDANIDLKGKAEKKISNSGAIAKLFNGSSNVGGDRTGLKSAHIALTAASGADILAAIQAAKDGTGKGAAISAAKNAYDIAVATKDNVDANAAVNTNASALAAGLALRAMAQGGKLATVATQAPHEEINSVLIGVVDKTVNEIISTIRRTVDKCLKDVNDCIKEDSSSAVKSNK